MKIVEPRVELMTPIDGAAVLGFVEKCGRVCYKSEANIKTGSAEKFVRMLIKRGHESVLEHVSFTFKIICDRATMDELTRHRLASFSVESSRRVKYDELTFVGDAPAPLPPAPFELFEKVYQELVASGYPPEMARAILPLSTAITVVMTANLREWRHVLRIRTDKAAAPQMRQVAGMILAIFKEKIPAAFEDIAND